MKLRHVKRIMRVISSTSFFNSKTSSQISIKFYTNLNTEQIFRHFGASITNLAFPHPIICHIDAYGNENVRCYVLTLQVLGEICKAISSFQHKTRAYMQKYQTHIRAERVPRCKACTWKLFLFFFFCLSFVFSLNVRLKNPLTSFYFQKIRPSIAGCIRERPS
jgi:hypothetical protein